MPKSHWQESSQRKSCAWGRSHNSRHKFRGWARGSSRRHARASASSRSILVAARKSTRSGRSPSPAGDWTRPCSATATNLPGCHLCDGHERLRTHMHVMKAHFSYNMIRLRRDQTRKICSLSILVDNRNNCNFFTVLAFHFQHFFTICSVNKRLMIF